MKIEATKKMKIEATKKQIDIILEFWEESQTPRIEAKEYVEKILDEGITYFRN